jgi:hypothetical protein
MDNEPLDLTEESLKMAINEAKDVGLHCTISILCLEETTY